MPLPLLASWLLYRHYHHTLSEVTSPTSTTVPPVLDTCSTAGRRTPPTLRGLALSTLTNTRSPTGFTLLNCECVSVCVRSVVAVCVGSVGVEGARRREVSLIAARIFATNGYHHVSTALPHSKACLTTNKGCKPVWAARWQRPGIAVPPSCIHARPEDLIRLAFSPPCSKYIILITRALTSTV